MSAKLRLAMYWAAGCGGCDIALLEIHEKILTLLEHAEIVFWPCLVDFKIDDVLAMPDRSIDVCLFNGAIRNSENIAMARLLRQKSRLLIAYGACATSGGIPGLANFSSREDLLDRVYDSSESTVNPERTRPSPRTDVGGGVIELPTLTAFVRPLLDIVPVDYSVPGCPPVDTQTWRVLETLLSGELPAPPAILGAGEKSVCDECPLEKRGTKISAFRRVTDFIPNGRTCLLEQGLVCLGPVTRSGCGAQCLQVNMPCRGCYGPAGDAECQGAKMVGLLGSLMAGETEEEIAACMDTIVDPAGTFNRFGLAVSTLRRAKPKSSGGRGPA